MTYTVIWRLTALLQSDQLVASSADPRSVRQAIAFVDYALRRDPLSMGESRAGNARLWYWDIVGVYYTVDDVAMRVDVRLVGPARRH